MPRLLLQLHPVGGGGALVLARGDRPGQLHRAAVEQELLRQRGLAGIRVGDDGEGAAAGDLVVNLHRGVFEETELLHKVAATVRTPAVQAHGVRRSGRTAGERRSDRWQHGHRPDFNHNEGEVHFNGVEFGCRLLGQHCHSDRPVHNWVQ